ncbi:MAG: glucose 1-dehydrogenase [Candidatus Latescibacterota bacterium]|nr:glucose 1-dehydrogenase [Candidatus Latescibacterota bacterium]
MPKLDGKTAVITGAGGKNGIGRAIALRLARDGADVVVNDLTLESPRGWGGIRALKEEIEAMGRRSEAIASSVAEPNDVRRLIDIAVERLGGVDILVNNAGAAAGPDRQPIVDLPESEWDRVQSVNARGTFLCCRAAARVMIEGEKGGRIINIASLAGLRGIPRFGAYCVSKFAVVGLTQVLALELALHQITVNAICPGLVDTERVMGMASGLKPEGTTTENYRKEMIASASAKNPMGRVATSQDIARSAAFLASDEADYITGHSLTVTGGADLPLPL